MKHGTRKMLSEQREDTLYDRSVGYTALPYYYEVMNRAKSMRPVTLTGSPAPPKSIIPSAEHCLSEQSAIFMQLCEHG